ncbi:hypothetical protein BC938DRAFT_482679 [Jimgerdemannia flammicorona]|uniref:Uncharacterized protein n=1 Tax=Jimgerdemannia flammicorona TaxID=994334 RepID=A0A433QWB6_9FUNG|nr:hypothetical protein BC938DRAFT_482679 [Jimgerdemannia flammicorona]
MNQHSYDIYAQVPPPPRHHLPSDNGNHYHSQGGLEPYLAQLGISPAETYANYEPADKPSFIEEINSIDDVEFLRRLVIEKEREKQSIANDLDIAARLGLAISETNEEMQVKVLIRLISVMEHENQYLHSELMRSTELTNQLMSRDDQSRSLTEQKMYMNKELDMARRELRRFRKELDGLSGQLNDMANDMVDSRGRAGSYAKKLGKCSYLRTKFHCRDVQFANVVASEVEHNLTTTQEMNVNLQNLLEKALNTQKQSNANTTHVVRNIQSDLTRVVQENDRLRSRIAELEEHQSDCENKLAEMIDKAKEYASLLEQAQDTIHTLSEPRLDDMSVSHIPEKAGKETEITKGSLLSTEITQEIEKEIEKKLVIKMDIKNRIVKHDSIVNDRRKAQEGLKYLLPDRDVSTSYAYGRRGSFGSDTSNISAASAVTLPAVSFINRVSPTKSPSTPTRIFQILTGRRDGTLV